MTDYTITISGPGGCVNNLLVVIQKALEDYHFKVEVNNPHPPEMSSESHLGFVGTLKEPGSVTINMTHYPWGG